jgi:hypothetical protein
VYAAPSAMKAIGGVVIGVGTVLVLIAAVWGRSGYYLSEAPILLLLALGGLACVGIGLALYRSTPSNSTVEPEASESVATRALAAHMMYPAAVLPPHGQRFAQENVDETTRDRPIRRNWQLVLPDGVVINILGGVVVGRRPVSTSGEATLVLASDQVSAAHAQFSLQSGRLFVRDLGSTNGTVLVRADGAETAAGAEPIPVDVDDRLELGTFVVRIAQRGWHDDASA